LNIKRKPQGDVMVLLLSGKIMGGPDYEKFHSEIKTLINDGFVDVLLDFSKVAWINSTGIGLLVTGYHTLKRNGGRMKVCSVGPRVESIIMVTQLDRVFDVFESCDEAVKSFAES
jgi:anti-sigma B factor antagonist